VNGFERYMEKSVVFEDIIIPKEVFEIIKLD
jgi:hypothetical protein